MIASNIPARGVDLGLLSVRLDRRWHVRIGRLVIAHYRPPSRAPLIDRASLGVTTARPGHDTIVRWGRGYAIRPLRASVSWLEARR